MTIKYVTWYKRSIFQVTRKHRKMSEEGRLISQGPTREAEPVGWMDRWRMLGQIEDGGWMNGWMNGKREMMMNGWMGGWTNGWMERKKVG